MQFANPILASLSSASALREELEQSRVVSPEQLAASMAVFPGGGALRLAEFLVSRGDLTPFQAERALSGQARSLLVGPYRILEPHHVGTFGPLFRATNGEREFAVRVLPLRSLWQAKQARDLVRMLGVRNDVRGFVPLADADSSQDSHYLAWPLVEGELLADRVRDRGPFSITGVIELLSRLAGGLADCHACNIIHGLLTPQSICLDPRGKPLLLEVGAGMLLAQNLAEDDSLFDTMSAALAVAGAFDFAAPEWVANPATLSPAMDQYALGAVCVFALTGAAPQAEAPVAEGRMPRPLARLLERMMKADPAERFPGMPDVVEAVALLSHREPTETANKSNEAETPEANGAIRFDVGGWQEEETAQAAAPAVHPKPTPRIEQREAKRRPPKPLPFAEPIRDSDIPPVLPAAPLAPAPERSSGSKCWNVATANPVSRNAKKPPARPPLWRRLRESLRFWKPEGDTVQVSVFGPAVVMRSQSPQLTVFVHTPSVAESVTTLAHAFHHDAVLLGTGALASKVEKGTPLDVHVAMGPLSVSNPLGGLTWQGQPHRLTYNFVVPWEVPLGPSVGLISIGRNDVRVGKVEFGVSVRG